ncbi:MAG: DUF4347 domain-containing protein, partial [Cyanobacteria bacterium P01_H01_bin.153]
MTTAVLASVARPTAATSLALPSQQVLVIIDPGVPDYQQLVAGVLPGVAAHVLDPQRDAISQITAAIHAAATPITQLYLVVHGSPGVPHFSSGDLSLVTLADHA